MPTEKELENYLGKLTENDPDSALKIEFGRFLMRNVSSLNKQEMKRYLYLREKLKIP